MVRGTHWLYVGSAYVTADGNYGGDDLLIFDRDALTEQQWEELGNLTDSDRIAYVQRILNGEQDTYTITRLDTWDDETWAEVVDAVERTTESFG